MKNYFLLLAVTILLFSTSCEENYYEISNEIILGQITFLTPSQIEEENRIDLNVGIPYENNQRIGAELILQITDPGGTIIFEENRVLLDSEGLLTTGKLPYPVSPGDYIVRIKNIPNRDYAYELPEGEGNNSYYQSEVEIEYGLFQFNLNSNVAATQQGGALSSSSNETFELLGGNARLDYIRIYRKVEGGIHPSDIYHYLRVSDVNSSTYNQSQANNESGWTTQSDGWYSILVTVNYYISQQNGSQNSYSLDIQGRTRSISTDFEVEGYIEFIFTSLFEEYVFQSEESHFTLLRAENVQEVYLDADDINEDQGGFQQSLYYEFDVEHTDTKQTRVELFLNSDEQNVEDIFEALQIVNDENDVVLRNLDIDPASWISVGGGFYKIDINSIIADIVQEGDEGEYRIDFKLLTGAEEDEITVYLKIHFEDSNGITYSVISEDDTFEIE